MAAGFDIAALTYDTDFTYSEIGKLQRAAVRRQLDKILGMTKLTDVLELGCGTGEDALWLSNRGLTVTATDASAGMIDQALLKNNSKVTFIQSSFEEVDQKVSGQFDLVFSNFGALNCASPQQLATLMETVRQMIRPGGIFIGVVMPRDTAWERFYFMLKGLGSRRNHSKTTASINGGEVSVYYYNPDDFLQLAPGYRKLMLRPVGFFVPPSYLEAQFRRSVIISDTLSALEKAISSAALLSRFSDHYFLALQPR